MCLLLKTRSGKTYSERYWEDAIREIRAGKIGAYLILSGPELGKIFAQRVAHFVLFEE